MTCCPDGKGKGAGVKAAWERFQGQMTQIPSLQNEERDRLWASKIRICYEYMTPKGCRRGDDCVYEQKTLEDVLAALGCPRQQELPDEDDEEAEEEEAADEESE